MGVPRSKSTINVTVRGSCATICCCGSSSTMPQLQSQATTFASGLAERIPFSIRLTTWPITSGPERLLHRGHSGRRVSE